MKKIKLGISVGDLNGVGIEIILKTFKDSRMLDFCTPIIFCSNKIISKYNKLIGMQDLNFNVINSIKDINYKKCNILNISKEDVEIKFGSSTSISGKYAYSSLKKSIEELKNNKIDVLVTAPINKNSIKNDVPDFIGHTELLEKEFKGDALMIMTSDVMKIACATGHMPLSDVSKTININTIIKKTKILNQSLISDFGII
ncbi:MAG: 4-hydroxythreonine-4-phosphate dehydrogenase PdxA, partial [Bacteroidota bacterium]|nr:4-hydroxythreonine-4-phosphate dehydrogenase PdxA [Bacteroidota bacterium]